MILGDSFLRSAYVVYDLINNQAAIAQTNFNATDSNIVTFASLGAQVPSATSGPEATATDLASGVVTTTATSFPAASGFSANITAGGGKSAGVSLRPSEGLLGVSMTCILAMMFGFILVFT